MSDDSTPRRSEGRFSVNSEATRVTATFTDSSGVARRVQGQLADMSLHGVRFNVDYRLALGEVIELKIEFPELSLTIRRSGVVRWQQPRDASSWWTGCELTEPLPEEIVEQLARAHVVNRRRDPRYEVDRPAQVRTELSNAIYATRLVNYSKGGFCLLFAEPIDLPHERLMLLLPAGDTERPIPARVMWSGSTRGRFAVGCAFTNMDGYVHVRDYAEPKRPRRRLMLRTRSSPVSFTFGLAIVVTIGLQITWLVQTRPDLGAAFRRGWSTLVVEPLREHFGEPPGKVRSPEEPVPSSQSEELDSEDTRWTVPASTSRQP